MTKNIIDWAVELQSLAQAGLFYSKDPFDIERFERIREISAELLTTKTDLSIEKVKDLFCGEVGYQTPKLDTRAAIFKDDQILLVQEKDERWSLPGGWVDVTCSVKENVIKEVQEEAGLLVEPVKIIGIQDRDKHNLPRYAYKVIKVFISCRELSGAFVPNIETIQSGYFSLEDLPKLAEEKNTVEQVELCFAANADPDWQTYFD